MSLTVEQIISRIAECNPDADVSSFRYFEGGEALGEYIVGPALGEGRCATVWTATRRVSGEETHDNKSYAVKVFRRDTEYLNDYYAEIGVFHTLCAAAQHQSPHVVSYYGTFVHMYIDDHKYLCLHPCIVMDLATSSARHLVDDYPDGVPLYAVKRIIQDTFRGVAHLHAIGMIHTDIKPENILINYTRQDAEVGTILCDLHACIGDLGSVTYAAKPTADPVTTVGYEAPERLIGGTYDGAVDVWATMVSCYELITSGYLFDVLSEDSTPYDYPDLAPLVPITSQSAEEDSAHIIGGDMSDGSVSSDLASSSCSVSSSGDCAGIDPAALAYRKLLLTALVIGLPPATYSEGAPTHYVGGRLANDETADGDLLSLMCRHAPVDYDDAVAACAFIMKGMTYLPVDRITPAAALADPWFDADIPAAGKTL